MSDTNELRKTRSALCNLTNRPLKRGISVISGGSELKSGDGYGRKVDIQIGDSKFAKKVCLFKGADFEVDGNEKGLPVPKGKEPHGSSSSNSSDTDASQDNRESFISSLRKEIKRANDLDGGRVHPSAAAEGGDASQESRESFISNLHIDIKKDEDLDARRVHQSVASEGDDATRDSSMSSISMATCSGFWNKDCSGGVASNYQDDDLRHDSDATKTKSCLAHVPAVTLCKNSKQGRGADKHASTKCDPSEWVKLFDQAVEKVKHLDGRRVHQSVVEEGGDASQNRDITISNLRKEIKKVKDLDGSKVDQSIAAEGGDATRDSSLSSISMATCSGFRNKDCSGGVASNYQNDDLRHGSDATKTKSCISHVPAVTLCKNSKKGRGADKHASTKCDPSEWGKLFDEAVEKAKHLDACRAHQSVVEEGGDASQNRDITITNLRKEIKKVKDLDGSKVDQSVAAEGGDATRDSSLSSILMATCSGYRNKDCSGGVASNYQDDDSRHDSDATKTKSGLAHVPAVTLCKNSKEDRGADKHASTKCDPSEWGKLFDQAVEKAKHLDGRRVNHSVVEEGGDASQNRDITITNLHKEIKKVKDLDGSKVDQSVAAEGGDASQENRESLISNLCKEIKKTEDLDGGRVHQSVAAEGGDATRDSSLSSILMATCSGFWNKDCSGGAASNYQNDGLRHDCGATKSKSGLAHVPVVTVCKNSKEACSADKQASTKCNPSEWSKLFMQSVKSRELGRCSTLKGDGSGNTDVNEEFLKACSCSFCLKAAYIWADLQYQDIKGRISALKKSQKEANTLVHKSCTEEASIHGRGSPIKSSSLESDLSGQWRSLFCHMEDILIQESNQLQASFLSLKDLRENCKMDLEMSTKCPQRNNSMLSMLFGSLYCDFYSTFFVVLLASIS
ncbi:LOW QUALITY PROTEIN: uncharacterized protein LOC133804763 [Humulus lupulus]|uniref:LOW QUALITY PROTEIN: uncharacterized protein LOC133804763 n=1 Tax=Humulus lupulus TaxID=3486 RepID=UPI002B414130|nr:LOW QUALITY PROTEIN: uncharacterized protein LOC133804763 [Humulus lupulus]